MTVYLQKEDHDRYHTSVLSPSPKRIGGNTSYFSTIILPTGEFFLLGVPFQIQIGDKRRVVSEALMTPVYVRITAEEGQKISEWLHNVFDEGKLTEFPIKTSFPKIPLFNR